MLTCQILSLTFVIQEASEPGRYSTLTLCRSGSLSSTLKLTLSWAFMLRGRDSEQRMSGGLLPRVFSVTISDMEE